MNQPKTLWRPKAQKLAGNAGNFFLFYCLRIIFTIKVKIILMIKQVLQDVDVHSLSQNEP